jgi:SOS-response transcriptional repressor LexA
MTGDTAPLSGRQRAILAAIRDSVRDRGYPPSIREIGEAAGYHGTSGVAYQLSVLERKGFLRRQPGCQRALEVTEPGRVQAGAQDRLEVLEKAIDRTSAALIAEAVAAERERAEAAEAKLAGIEAYCRKHAEHVNLYCPDLGRPATALVEADRILAIITGEVAGNG